MNGDKQHAVWRESIEKYGKETQSIVCMEECSELIQAVSKRLRGKPGATDNLAEEMADVIICLYLLKEMYDITDEQLEEWIARKTARQSKRMQADDPFLEGRQGRGMSAYQPVLDPACGGRMFWFDKSDSRVLFGDVRDESWELCDGRRFEVKPDMLMDYRDLPFPDETFRMVVLDPPHLRNAGETSYMAQKYGCLDQETWKTDIKTMFSECFRVLQPCGTLIFKWNETQIPVSQILKLTDHKPLFGNKQPNRTGTHWIVFIKEDTE